MPLTNTPTMIAEPIAAIGAMGYDEGVVATIRTATVTAGTSDMHGSFNAYPIYLT